MVNKVWAFFIIVGIIFCVLTGNLKVLNEEILSSADTAFNMILKIFPVMALWLGIMKIAEDAGLLNIMSKKISKILKYLFPEIPQDHVSLSYIASNIICNMFGLGNAATPFGLKAMESLQELNSKKDTASKSMITFLVINTSGLTIVPTTILSLRILHKSTNPTIIVLPCILATFISTVVGLFFNYLFARRK
jgi:spore maturation protein A